MRRMNRKGCFAGTRSSRSTYENSSPLRSSDPRILASHLARIPESDSLGLVSRLFQRPASVGRYEESVRASETVLANNRGRGSVRQVDSARSCAAEMDAVATCSDPDEGSSEAKRRSWRPKSEWHRYRLAVHSLERLARRPLHDL